MSKVKDLLRNIINSRYRVSFSKSGEDIQLFKLFNKLQGKYLDIGCFEPVTFSNTYFFYLKGWDGYVVDPNPTLTAMFKKIRPKDVFINRGISGEAGTLDYYMLPQKMASMNTFDYSFLEKNNLTSYVEKEIKIPLCTLEELVDEFKLKDKIDFIDVDVEGLDLEVLQSNNWETFRPSIVMVETDLSLDQDMDSPVTRLLEDKDYRILAKLVQSTSGSGNLIFCKKEFNPKK
ncbi:FkbM family methyltransferase [Algoriphagus litoralis]|uniref:FkbM family methyltransferase n=1 Tax=Algoriphagus litoralis TaxID=2202829 RepID=UPI000DBA22CE|nr:FkbM family methyltransferase [Algoriphagus litoralis]